MQTTLDKMLADKNTQYVKSIYRKWRGLYRVFAVYYNPKFGGIWSVAGETLTREKYKILTAK